MQPLIRPRRLFVTGASRLTEPAANLWRHLGARLAAEPGLVVITGGLAGRTDEPGAATADRTIVEGMLPVLHAHGVSPEERIETFLPDARHDWRKLLRSRHGRVRVLEKKTPQARRFSMVHTADVVVSVEGEEGTRSSLDLALAIERPVLPLPFGGGASAEVWREQREEILAWFRVTPEEVAYFEGVSLPDFTDTELDALAERVHACLMRGFTQGCFVIMRFHEESDPVYEQAIMPALSACGYQPWRTDRSVPAGDVQVAIRDGLKHCYFAVADITGERPNVMYEVGFAHALAKPVILLRQAGTEGGASEAPFDVRTHQILLYSADDLANLQARLKDVVSALTMKQNEPAFP